MRLETCHHNLVSGDGSMLLCLAGLTKEVVPKGGNATTVTYVIMDLILVLEPTYLGVGVKSCPAIDRYLRESFQTLEEERIAHKKKKSSGCTKPSKRIRASRPSLTCASKEDIDEIVAKFFYVHGLNLNVVNSLYFHDMAKAISTFGPGYEPLSVDELSDSFLSREKGRIERSLALVRESWPHTESSILCFCCLESMLGCFRINIFISNPRRLMVLRYT